MAPASSGAAEASAIKRVLVLHHYGQEIPYRAAFDATIQEALRSRNAEPLEIYFEAIESYRFPETTRSGVVRDYLKAKYGGRQPDVIIAVLDTVLAFLHQNPDVFPEVPIVALVTRESLETGASDVTGLQQQLAIRDTLAFALNLEPATERVFVVEGALYNTGDIETEVRRQVGALDHRLELVYLRDLPMVDLIARIEAIPERSILLFIRQVMWDRATPLDLREGIRRLAQASPVPMFALSSEQIGMGPVGGHVVQYEPDAIRLAEMALRILNGESPRDILPGQATIAATVDWRQLRRWRIPEARLPAGTIVLFREFSTWERHRAAILAGSGVLVLQSLLIVGLALERRRRRRAEIDARRHLVSMAHLDRRAAMGELATSLAHELNQPLNAILQNAGVAQMLMTSNPLPPGLVEMAEIISDIRKDDLRASEMIRRLRGLLQKHELEAQPVDLNEVAQDTVAIIQPEARAREIQLELDLDDDVRPILGDRVHLQQVLLNLLMNAVDAVTTMPPERRRVRAWTRARDGEVRLGVADTGVGIPTDRLSQVFEPFYTTKGEGSGMGMGLAIARSIVDAHAGHIAAEHNAGGGTSVWFSVTASSGRPPEPADRSNVEDPRTRVRHAAAPEPADPAAPVI